MNVVLEYKKQVQQNKKSPAAQSRKLSGLSSGDIAKVINTDCFTYTRTNGGLHCLIKLDLIDPQYAKSWYMNVSKMSC